ncbi:mediator of RNA polymerase II transcription subunit 15a-like isoform X2 [Papaver somniferum]|uniref:mediator of RNA polymerase II transcription subunit 15a-like isoform X2 n=1 Tax=Papaver somniferum TaxID=3469 RepID=UPI000E7045C5|nr:mediator of RNA polymerase II transcription subunit 15a-like isoform X2 [Papaver somniferum]
MGATTDWRTQVQPDSRHRIVTKILETLERQFSISGPEGWVEIKKIAVRFEEDMFTAATSQVDYLRKISLKMLTLETKSQTNGVPNLLPLNSGGGSQNPQQTGSQEQQSQSSQQFLYQQQHLLKQKQQQQQGNNLSSIMQSHMQQQQPKPQQQKPIQSTQLQYTQQPQLHQQAPVLHQQQHTVLPSRQQMNVPNLQPNQLIGQQNNVSDMQQQKQQELLNLQNDIANMQQHLLGNNIPHQQQLGQQSNMSGLQKQHQQPMHTMHQQRGKVQQQQNAQMHQQLEWQQQPNSLEKDMQQKVVQTSGGSMLNHPNLVDQKQVLHSQMPPPEASSTLLDAAIIGNVVDVQEEVYQKIECMREKYLPDLNDMHRKISKICQQHDSLPHPPKSEQIERLRIFKNILGKMMGFLNLPKSSVIPSLKDKLASYEEQLLNIMTLNRAWKAGPLQQQIQPTGCHQLPSSRNVVDVQEEVYQIKSMREKYLPDLIDFHQKISRKCQQHDSLPHPPKSEQIERLKIFKNMLDKMVAFLNLPKSSAIPSLKVSWRQ